MLKQQQQQGRNFDEILRVVDSLQLTTERKLATPANWVPGQECVVVSFIFVRMVVG